MASAAGRRTLVFVIAVVLLGTSGRARAEGGSWATAQAAELTRQAESRAAHGEGDVARARYLEAIRFDATYGPAYLGLGALQERAGEALEAERAYSMGLDHVGGFVDGYRARAALRLRQRRFHEALADLESATALRENDVALLQELARAYVATSALPAALCVERRLIAIATAAGDRPLVEAAWTQVRALSRLLGDADPVRAGRSGRGPARRALARHAAGATR